ncbi:MAG: nucleotidyltransferase domain-containing protein [Prevotellaceae bacterium]|jgi:predicted nucleotidyltransferase|nr:nucleotidyltransferase domain-containing protein [Prevotellaceae bacterium]
MKTTNEYIHLLRRFERAHAAEYGIIRMGIFGSVARKEHTNDSDIDVVVQLKQPDLFTLAGIKLDLEKLYHKPVDVVIYSDTMNAFLKQQIDRETLYA